jgi:hypothetical protein
MATSKLLKGLRRVSGATRKFVLRSKAPPPFLFAHTTTQPNIVPYIAKTAKTYAF